MENLSNFFIPSLFLQKYINYYHFIRIDKAGINNLQQKPVSNGCIQIFICYEGSNGIGLKNDGSPFTSKSAIFGIHHIKNNIQGTAFGNSQKVFKCITVDFKANGFYEIFKIPAGQFYNNFFDSSEVFGREIDHLTDQIDDSANDLQRVAILNQFFKNKFLVNQSKDYKIKHGLEILELVHSFNGTLGVKQLIEKYNTTERTLERIFKNTLGISPKEYCKMVRVNNLIQFMYSTTEVNWFEVINRFNYYDQTHMIKEFKSATTITPEVFLKRKNKDLFIMKRHLVFINN